MRTAGHSKDKPPSVSLPPEQGETVIRSPQPWFFLETPALAKAGPPLSMTGRRTTIPLAAVLLLTLAPAFTTPTTGSPIALDLDFLVSHDDFERSFPGSTWTVGDGDPAGGLDYWGSSSARAFAGNGSAWSSQVGNRTFAVLDFSEDFDGNVTGWTFSPDRVATYGDDHWGLSSARAFSPNRSVWCAQVGRQATAGANNSAVRLYDSYMNASFSRSVNVSGWTSATLEYRFWLNSQANNDWLYEIGRAHV